MTAEILKYLESQGTTVMAQLLGIVFGPTGRDGYIGRKAVARANKPIMGYKVTTEVKKYYGNYPEDRGRTGPRRQ